MEGGKQSDRNTDKQNEIQKQDIAMEGQELKGVKGTMR